MTENALKIAICLSGTSKYPERSLNSIKNVLPNDQISVFIHTWDIKDRIKYDEHSWSKYDFDFNNNILSEFNAKKILIENYDDKFNNFIKQYNELTFSENRRKDVGVLSMFYSIFKANTLKTQYEKDNDIVFDFVIRMRFDSNFCDKNLELNSEFFNKRGIYIPNGNDYDDGLNDQFAVGDSKSMDIYSDLYNNMEIFNECIYHPESMLKLYMEKTNTTIHRFDMLVNINNS